MQKYISAAVTEAQHSEHGVGIVRVPGKAQGFLNMEACIASKDMQVCLVPEFRFEMNSASGLLSFVFKRLQISGSCVLVVSEGARTAYF